MGSNLVWQAQSRDDIVVSNIIEQLIKTSASKQILVKQFLSTGIWAKQFVDEFFSHLNSLYELSIPIVKLADAKDTSKNVFDFFTGNEEITNSKIKLSFELYNNLITGFKGSGIWNVRKEAHFKHDVKGFKSVRGT